MALPSGVSALAVRVARCVPDGILRWALPKRLGFISGLDLSEPAPAQGSTRVYIGPVNFAGQGWQWARAAERLPDVSAWSMAYEAGGFRFAVDQDVPAATYVMSRPWQHRQRTIVASQFTHVIVEAGRHLFGNVYGESVADEIRWLQARGVRVGMLTHGSDMRVPDRHAETHDFSPFRGGEWSMTPVLAEEAARNRNLLDDVQVPVFVSTPGMLVDVPEGEWLPVVIEPERWESEREPLESVPLVVHAPSNAVVKGTALIEPQLIDLAEQGVIRYERIEGVPSAEMPALFERADIVVDQVRIGDYGVAACEAMAAGRLVLGNVDDQVREHVRAVTGRELPIVQADPHTIGEVLRDLLADRDRARATAAQGPRFVREVHDGRLSARVLSGFLGIEHQGTTHDHDW